MSLHTIFTFVRVETATNSHLLESLELKWTKRFSPPELDLLRLVDCLRTTDRMAVFALSLSGPGRPLTWKNRRKRNILEMLRGHRGPIATNQR